MSLQIQLAIANKRGGALVTGSGFVVAPPAPALPTPAPTPSLPGAISPAAGEPTARIMPIGKPVILGAAPVAVARPSAVLRGSTAAAAGVVSEPEGRFER